MEIEIIDIKKCGLILNFCLEDGEELAGTYGGKEMKISETMGGRTTISSNEFSSSEGLRDVGEIKLKLSPSFPKDKKGEAWVLRNLSRDPWLAKVLIDRESDTAVLWETMEPIYLFDLEHWIELDNGKWLFNNHGKYKPNMTFVLDQPQNLKWAKARPSDFGLEKGNLFKMRGKFWTSKKGAKCFQPSENGPHLLVQDDWGGCPKYRGYQLEKLPSLYYRRAESHGGGSGIDYAVIKR